MSSDKAGLIRKSKIHHKIALFFIENDGSIDTPRGVSTWINENIKTVRIALEDLVKIGFLTAHRTSSTIGYSCALTKKELAKLTEKLKKNPPIDDPR